MVSHALLLVRALGVIFGFRRLNAVGVQGFGGLLDLELSGFMV